MKLIDLLVQELPKCGGWPGAMPALVQNSSGYIYQASGGDLLYCFRLADDWMNAEVTCEKYFDALRASEPRPGSLLQYGAVDDEWDGAGLPPVGSECEALMPRSKGELWEWRKVKVVVSGIKGAENECLVYDVENLRPAWVDEFRPIRSEADKKRDAAVSELVKIIGGPGGPYAEVKAAQIYDAIKSGDIVIE